jgi:hypothetical protein
MTGLRNEDNSEEEGEDKVEDKSKDKSEVKSEESEDESEDRSEDQGVRAGHLQADVAGAQADELHVVVHQPGHRAQHQVRALLVVQPPNEAHQRHLPPMKGYTRHPAIRG